MGCGKVGEYVCQECEVGVWEEEQICPICCRNSRYGLKHIYCHKTHTLDGLICLWAYEGIVRKLIHKIKYKYYFDYLQEFSFIDKPEFAQFKKFLQTRPSVVPVPLYEKRYRKRGFNQAEIIADYLAKNWKIEAINLLTRIRDTGQQVGRLKKERLENMAGAFKISKLSNLPENVLLVDDVWTTGATMSECCKILKQKGVKKVWGLVLAR